MNHDAEPRRIQLRRAQAAGTPAIVVGIDGSATSWDAFAWAAGEAVRSHGHLVAVYVMPYTEPTAAFAVPYAYGAAAASRQDLADEIEAEAVRRAGEAGVPIHFISEYGEPIGTLSDVARAVNAHLVVVGRSAKPWHRLTGSLGHRLTCRKDAPVVVVVP
ncbi:universal stress protein [Kribbella sp. NBC_00709]|uniref:universal stress protein n=1 Tax=Kribbella sp. NBC_00709 TaxID=2975972 RepID=UPI002E2D5749|nr:universal stress protein [Kribbella sp. NBC_00709]